MHLDMLALDFQLLPYDNALYDSTCFWTVCMPIHSLRHQFPIWMQIPANTYLQLSIPSGACVRV